MKTSKSKIRSKLAVLVIIAAVAFTLLTAACTPKQKEPQKLEAVIKPTEQQPQTPQPEEQQQQQQPTEPQAEQAQEEEIFQDDLDEALEDIDAVY